MNTVKIIFSIIFFTNFSFAADINDDFPVPCSDTFSKLQEELLLKQAYSKTIKKLGNMTINDNSEKIEVGKKRKKDEDTNVIIEIPHNLDSKPKAKRNLNSEYEKHNYKKSNSFNHQSKRQRLH